MPDVFTQAKRSEVMSRIRSRGNRNTELALAKLVRRQGITGWRRQRQLTVRSRRRQSALTSPPSPTPKNGADSHPRLQVRPDFVFPKLRLAVFVDGCFWHACPLHATKPRNHAVFWQKKLSANRARDRLVNHALRAAGWRVLRVWEHELARKREARLLRRLRLALS